MSERAMAAFVFGAAADGDIDECVLFDAVLDVVAVAGVRSVDIDRTRSDDGPQLLVTVEFENERARRRWVDGDDEDFLDAIGDALPGHGGIDEADLTPA
ncbi:hypothetical protein SAMN06269185_1246 [Natronoarchaeum philippinense]|uniref:Uncharacterized protein n=1 Tax=Natronoarchaeum philippinense TaxID=558529 RepID=A0A285NAZ5_NATPI|nr:hypothetical protein [Natronoarchaeum philippinense]SNZ06664.1 hypothetical protein SAMN06269185_1246 [Natronoarchaeum philippinense]